MKVLLYEKKFQQVGGSVCEKLQTYAFKIQHYQKTYPNYNVKYVYCLSDWFKDNCKAEIKYLEEKTRIFWGDSPSYKDDIKQFILSCEEYSLDEKEILFKFDDLNI